MSGSLPVQPTIAHPLAPPKIPACKIPADVSRPPKVFTATLALCDSTAPGYRRVSGGARVGYGQVVTSCLSYVPLCYTLLLFSTKRAWSIAGQKLGLLPIPDRPNDCQKANGPLFPEEQQISSLVLSRVHALPSLPRPQQPPRHLLPPPVPRPEVGTSSPPKVVRPKCFPLPPPFLSTRLNPSICRRSENPGCILSRDPLQTPRAISRLTLAYTYADEVIEVMNACDFHTNVFYSNNKGTYATRKTWISLSMLHQVHHNTLSPGTHRGLRGPTVSAVSTLSLYTEDSLLTAVLNGDRGSLREEQVRVHDCELNGRA